MYIRFGNLTVKEFAKLVDADFTDKEIETLESYRTDIAEFDLDEPKFHIFRDPLSILISDQALKDTIHVWKAANERKTFNREVPFSYPQETFDHSK